MTTIYRSKDGQEFETPRECRRHEELHSAKKAAGFLATEATGFKDPKDPKDVEELTQTLILMHRYGFIKLL
jgi:hypothetical protein